MFFEIGLAKIQTTGDRKERRERKGEAGADEETIANLSEHSGRGTRQIGVIWSWHGRTPRQRVSAGISKTTNAGDDCERAKVAFRLGHWSGNCR